MTTQDIIDHIKAGRPLTKNVAKKIVMELERVKALEDELRRAKYEKSIMDSAAIEENEAYIQRLERAIKELISQDISEQYLNMVRKNTTAEELLEEERDSLRSKVKALEEAAIAVAIWWVEGNSRCSSAPATMLLDRLSGLVGLERK